MMITLAPLPQQLQQQIKQQSPEQPDQAILHMMLPTPTQPQRVKCGEVYTWDCAGELYGVECILCEERPLCTLAEFAEHMDIWHYSWAPETQVGQEVQDAEETHQTQESHVSATPCVATEREHCAHAQLAIWSATPATTETATPTPMATLTAPAAMTTVSNVAATVESGSVVRPTTVQRNANDMCAAVRAADDTKILTNLVAESLEPFEQVLITDEVTTKSNDNNAALDALTCAATTAAIATDGNGDGNDEEVSAELLDELAPIIGVEDKNHVTMDISNTGGEALQRGLNLASKLEQSISNYRQNVKLIEVYEQFPMLWHRAQRDLITTEKRAAAFRSISASLKLCGINLSALAVQRRVYWLRKRYRLEKFHDLSNQLRRLPFVASFKYYALMQFLDEHIEPHVCQRCGKIYKGDVCTCDREVAQQVVDVDENLEQCMGVTQIATEAFEPASTSVELVEEEVCAVMADSTAVEVNIYDNQCNDECEAQQLQKAVKSIANGAQFELRSSPQTLEMSTIEECEVSHITVVGTDNLQLDTPATSLDDEDSFSMPTDAEEGNDASSPEQTFARLTIDQTRKLIALYQEYPQLWDPSHVDFSSRKLRRVAWRLLTARFNKTYRIYYAWTTVHRKLSDYLKYYKREKQRIETKHSCTKWCFYDEFAFLDAALRHPSAEAQPKTLTKEQCLQIIEAYRAQPQLWNTEHVDFRRRSARHAQIVAMCAQLKSECGICITPEKLKQRFIEFRCCYRTEKMQRIAANACNVSYTSQYEFYEALRFIDAHVAPFICEQCGTQYKRHPEYVRHTRKQHPAANERKRRGRRRYTATDAVEMSEEEEEDAGVDKDAQDAAVSSTSNNNDNKKAATLQNVCHICGINFTLHRNLVYHLNRHLNRRTHACTMCPKKFFNSSSLRVHERAHTKSKPFICEQCGVGYINGSKLNQHMKRHREQRDYACGQCGKTFYTAFERDRHVRGHQKLREKVCPVCGRAFGVGTSYYAHMLLHSDVKRYACKPCGREFAQYAGLYKHRKRYHPTE